MARKTGRAKMNIPMCLAGILFCLTLFSVYLSSGVIARYSAVTAGADSARVIRFGDITLTRTEGSAASQYIYPGAVLTWNATVSFEGSESATYVFLEVIPNGWDVSVDGKTYTALHHDGAPGLIWSVADGWEYLGDKVYYRALEPNETLENVPVIKESKITVADTLEAADLAEMSNDFGLEFAASVVQSNGFEDEKVAWATLKSKNQA